MTSTIELQTPVEIDTEIARLLAERGRLETRRDHALRRGAHYRDQSFSANAVHKADEADEEAGALNEQIVELGFQIKPRTEEYIRRGGWNRFYLVTNTNGHVHWTTSCNTCFPDTDFAWLTQFSGTSHEDLVELAGEKACTVCFPDAPVDVLKRPSKLTTPEREAKDAAKAAKAAALAKTEVVVPNYHDGNKSVRKHVFKTVRGATNVIASNLNSMVHYGPTHPTFPYWSNDVHNTIAALVEKGEIEDADAYYFEALEKQRKKVRADHKKFMTSPAAASYRAQGILDPVADAPNYDPVKF